MAASKDRYKKKILALTELEHNKKCADCQVEENIENISMKLGMFVCNECARTHQQLGPSVSDVRKIDDCEFTREDYNRLKWNDNSTAVKKYEKEVPAYYQRPTKNSPSVQKEQWIKAKYERLEFDGKRRSNGYEFSEKRGILYKKGKKDKIFKPRTFVLEEITFKLSYYIKEHDKSSRGEIHIENNKLNAVLSPEKIGHPHGMHLTYRAGENLRNIYVYSEEGKDIVDWLNAIRRIKLIRAKIAFPSCIEAELCNRLTHNFVKEGFLLKKGPRDRDSYLRRWFILDGRSLFYFEDPLAAYPKGEISLGYVRKANRHNPEYSVKLGVPPGIEHPGYSFTLAISGSCRRDFHLSAETEKERNEWITILNNTFHTIPRSDFQD